MERVFRIRLQHVCIGSSDLINMAIFGLFNFWGVTHPENHRKNLVHLGKSYNIDSCCLLEVLDLKGCHSQEEATGPTIIVVLLYIYISSGM